MVAILLSTYNGEQHLEEQIKSICEQTYQDWNLYIRDDGSKDNTIQILNRLEQGDNRIHLIKNGGNLGVAKSFIFLLENSTADYYMFCDQDDVWLPTKIEASIHAIQKAESVHGSDTPLLAFTDQFVVDGELNTISDSYYSHCGTKKLVGKERFFLTGPMVPGCTMIFNNAAKRVCLPYTQVNRVIHDYWLMLRVLKNKGHLIFIPESLMLYRQHGKNVIGASYDRGSFLNRICKISNLIEKNIRIYKNSHAIGGGPIRISPLKDKIRIFI